MYYPQLIYLMILIHLIAVLGIAILAHFNFLNRLKEYIFPEKNNYLYLLNNCVPGAHSFSLETRKHLNN